MKITDVKPFPVRVGHRNQMLVKVETDAGIHGWGESGVSGRELAVEGAVKHYAQFLIGRDPMRRGALWQEMYRGQYFEGGRILTGAISAIDIALHDVAGKALGVPVYELLGGKHRDYVPTFATTSAPLGPQMIEQGKQLLEAGWTAFRMSSESVGIETDRLYEPRESIAKTAGWFIKAREALGRTAVLGVDYHHRLSVAEAASFCQMMPPGTLDFVEEPIRDECPDAYEALRKMTDIPFAIGEEFSSKWQFLPYIERGLTNYARLDVCNVGGFTEAMKVAGWAEAHYIDLMPHNPLGPVCTAASVHLGAAVPNFAWLETFKSPWAPDRHEDPRIFPKMLELEDARFPVPDEPGLGVEVNEAALTEPFRFWEAPHLHRRDGSYTNW
ncbi:MAG: mandelate racemase/muconate lactonizing enzyme family protein [Gemmatimonadetes bacterium]|nr:mandelate racemase/muconate lactonizing enzyme family protein [Gemmatimonadota bacterium]